MKTIGIIGGMSWQSSFEYYRIINEITREKLGGLHSAKSVMVSVDFAPLEEMQQNNQWDKATDVMIHTAKQLVSAGADFIVIATSTVMNPKNWTQKWGFLFNLSKHILPIPIVLKFNRCQIS